MNNKRILITEDERERILRMHENHAKRNNLNFGRLILNEEATYRGDGILDPGLTEKEAERLVKNVGIKELGFSTKGGPQGDVETMYVCNINQYPNAKKVWDEIMFGTTKRKLQLINTKEHLIMPTAEVVAKNVNGGCRWSVGAFFDKLFGNGWQKWVMGKSDAEMGKGNTNPKQAWSWDTTCNGSDAKPYKYGCKSDVIKQVQGCLGFTGDALDGKFGTNTKTAINNKLGRAYFVTNDVATLCPSQQINIGGGGTQDDIIKLPTKSAVDAANGLSQSITPQEPISPTQTDQEETTALNDLQQATQEFNQGKGDLRKLKKVKNQLERALRRKDKFMDDKTKQSYQNSITDLDNKIKQLGG